MSVIDKFLSPIFQLIGPMFAFFYGLVPNYAIAIILLTVAVMAVMSPLVVKSTRSMIQLQRLAPELKKIQQKYKGDRQRQNEEVMAFYKENHVNPAGGCLPMFLQLPVFFVLYGVLGGMVHTTGGKHPKLDPLYIPHNSALYSSLMHGHGKLMSFGLDLSNKALGSHSSMLAGIPFWTIVVVAIGLQYFQMRQLSGRSPQMAEMNPQMQAMQKYMPLFFGLIYLNISAGVNIYFIVSSRWRIGLQGLLFRFDPVIRAQPAGLTSTEQGANKQWNLLERLLSLGSSGGQPADGADRADGREQGVPASSSDVSSSSDGSKPGTRRDRPTSRGRTTVDPDGVSGERKGVPRAAPRTDKGGGDRPAGKRPQSGSPRAGTARPTSGSSGRSNVGPQGRSPGGSPRTASSARGIEPSQSKTQGKPSETDEGRDVLPPGNGRKPGEKKSPPRGAGGRRSGTR